MYYSKLKEKFPDKGRRRAIVEELEKTKRKPEDMEYIVELHSTLDNILLDSVERKFADEYWNNTSDIMRDFAYKLIGYPEATDALIGEYISAKNKDAHNGMENKIEKMRKDIEIMQNAYEEEKKRNDILCDSINEAENALKELLK